MAKFLFSAFADEASPDIIEQIAACKANGIEYIELRNVNGKNISNFTVEEAKELKKLLDDNGMKVSSIGSHYGKIEIDDDFAPHFEAFKQTVEVAKVLETKYIRMFSFFFTKGQSREEYKDEVYARLTAMVDYSNKHGILCCHENEKGIYGDITERCLELAEHFGDRMGCIFDPSNYIQCGSDTLEGFKLLQDYVTYFHVKDCIAEIDTVVPAGEGDGHLVEIMRMLDNKEGVYFLSVEPHLRVFEGLDNLEPDDATANAMNKKFVYPDNMTSFAAACTAIHNIIEKEIQPVRFGIIGVGNMGMSHVNMHLSGNHKELRITAVADIDPARLDAAKKAMPSLKTFDSAEALIDSGEVDVALIATPHYDHSPIAQYAFSKGVHVLTEKPAGVYTKQVREMNEAAAKTDLVFGIMYNQRTNCVYRKMREIIQSGELGEIRRVSWIITDWYRTQAYYNSGGWRATWKGEGGGVLLNQCPHNLDLWQWIFGMPKAVSAVAGSYITKGGYDNMSVNYMYGDGVFVHASCSWILHENKYNTRSFRVNCEKGYIYIDRSPGRETFVKVLNDGSVTDLSEKLPFDSWHNEIVYFTDRLSKGLPVTECMPVDCEDSIKIIMAEMKSADKEGMKVDIV